MLELASICERGVNAYDSARALLTLSPQKSDEYEYSAIGSVTRNELRAPQFCAFFVAHNMSFEETNTLFKQYLENEKVRAHRKNLGLKLPNDGIPSSAAEARSYVHKLEVTFPDKSMRSYMYARYKSLFWYLTLFDRQWFESRHPNGGRGATKHIPTIQEDRELILRAIQKANRSRVSIWKNLAQQASYRASLRDVTWLEMRKQETITEARYKLENQKSVNLELLEQELKKAHTSYISSNTKNVRISINSMAPYTIFSQLQLRYLASKNPCLKKYVSETKAEFDLRTSA